MTRRRALLLGGFILLLGVLAALLSKSGEPTYRGRTLTSWLAEPVRNNDLVWMGTGPATVHAIREIGAKGIPTLVNLLRTQDSTFHDLLAELSQKHLLPMSIVPAEDCREMAAYGFMVLREDARPAIPALVECLSDEHGRTRAAAVFCLGRVGRGSPEATAALLKHFDWTMSTNSSGRCDPAERYGTAIALGAMGPSARAAIPQIAKLTNDGTGFVRYSARLAIARMEGRPLQPIFDELRNTSNWTNWVQVSTALLFLGKDAEPALPMMLAGLRQTNAQLYTIAFQVVGALRTQPEACIPALAPLLQSTNAQFRRNALHVICSFGPDASQWMPLKEMSQCLQDPDPRVRESATNYLKWIKQY